MNIIHGAFYEKNSNVQQECGLANSQGRCFYFPLLKKKPFPLLMRPPLLPSGSLCVILAMASGIATIISSFSDRKQF
jgi:hypothetical protein